MHVTAKLPAICNSVLLISEILLMNTGIHTYTYSSDVCIYLFGKQRYHITSTFSARPFSLSSLMITQRSTYKPLCFFYKKIKPQKLYLKIKTVKERNYLNRLDKKHIFFLLPLLEQQHTYIFTSSEMDTFLHNLIQANFLILFSSLQSV